jgi:hypothetical protein
LRMGCRCSRSKQTQKTAGEVCFDVCRPSYVAVLVSLVLVATKHLSVCVPSILGVVVTVWRFHANTRKLVVKSLKQVSPVVNSCST